MAELSAIVTGASRGIGHAVAMMLARRGCSLTVSARDADRLDAVAEELLAAGSASVRPVAGDVSDDRHLDAIVERHGSVHDGLSVLVLNAGVGTAGGIAELPRARLDKTFAVNWRAPYTLVQRALPLLRVDAAAHTDRAARVIAMSSISGVYAEPGLAAYGASKAALNSLVDAINAEESQNGVLATAIAPGYVDTDMSGWVHDHVPPEQMIRVEDLVTLVAAVVDLSPAAVVPRLVVSRAGSGGYLA